MSARKRPLHEVVFEMTAGLEPAERRVDHVGAVASLLRMPGVAEAHVDEHHTWAMVAFDPEVASVAALTGRLAVHGLVARRMRTLPPAVDPGDSTEPPSAGWDGG